MSKDNALNVICPICDAWKGKPCVHTKGSRKGKKRDESHTDRTRLAKVKHSKSTEEKVSRIGSDYKEKKETKKNPREKLTPEQKANVEIIAEKIEALNRNAEFVGPVTEGPLISTYRFFPVKKTKVAHLEGMSKDFAVALGSDENILVKRMPGESTVGVFVPNKTRKKVMFQDTLPNVRKFMEKKTEDGHLAIPLNFGIDQNGYPFVDDLTELPHLLVAGTTGGGKSTWLHAIVQSMAWVLTPQQLKIGISDTKAVEFKAFKDLPHLLRDEHTGDILPICTDVYKTMHMLNRMVDETQTRLDRFAMEGVRNIHEYNKLVPEDKRIPYIVIVIDELFDLLGKPEKNEAKANSKKIEEIVGRARASGIYMIAATQRPAASLVKGQIKANFPARVSFRLPSFADSKTVLTTKGAECLMSKGDMLYMSSIHPELRRLHAPYTPLDETKDIVSTIIKREEDAKDARHKKYELQKSQEDKRSELVQ